MERVVFPLKRGSLYEDLLMDVYLWTQLHIQFSQLAAMATALLTHSWQMTIASAMAGSLVGRVVSELGHSDWIRRVGLMGSWMIGVIVCLLLVFTGQKALALTLAGVILANWSAVISAVLLPFIYPVTRSRFRRTRMRMPERTFVLLCNQRAARLGIRLNWALYDCA